MTNFYTGRASVWSRKKDYDNAIADCDEAIRIDPKAAWPPYQRSAHLLAARREGVLPDVKKVLELEGWRGKLSL